MTVSELSIVVVAHDEEDNVVPLIEEIERVVLGAGVAAEVIFVDDGSSDETGTRAVTLARTRSWLQVVRLASRCGISAGLHAGIRHARAPWLGTLDGDLQNDPADLVEMLNEMRRDSHIDLIQGDRSGRRADSRRRRWASWAGRIARRLLLGDPVRDTGCATRLIRRENALDLPLQFAGMHRFIPVLVRMAGGRVTERPVRHRPRRHGVSKFGVGVIERGWRGLRDCIAVRWMRTRYRADGS